MPKADAAFADYCCELLAPVGPCVAKRMFGGWGISLDGVTFAIVADLGGGSTLWLKGDETTAPALEAAGSRRFTYAARGVERSMGYYSAPEDALESPQLMAPWARQALACALKARGASGAKTSRAKPSARRAAAPAPSASARRKSAKG